MNKPLVYGGILVAIAIAIGAYYFPQAEKAFSAVTPSTTTGQYATESTGAPLWVLGNALIGPNSVGAIGYTGYISTVGARQLLLAATTTPCSIPNPLAAQLALGNVATATGTIQSFAFTVTAPTSTSVVVVVGTSTTAYATSSSTLSFTVPSGAQATYTYDGNSGGNVISPGQFIVVGAGAGSAAFTVGGSCQATVESAA